MKFPTIITLTTLLALSAGPGLAQGTGGNSLQDLIDYLNMIEMINELTVDGLADNALDDTMKDGS